MRSKFVFCMASCLVICFSLIVCCWCWKFSSSDVIVIVVIGLGFIVMDAKSDTPAFGSLVLLLSLILLYPVLVLLGHSTCLLLQYDLMVVILPSGLSLLRFTL